MGISEVRSNGWGNHMRQTDMNHEDYDAASFLQNLKAHQMVHQSQDMNAGSFGQGSWGNFTASPHPNMNPSTGLQNPHMPSSRQPSFSSLKHVPNPSLAHNQLQQAQWQAQMAHAQAQQQRNQQPQVDTRARHLSLDTSSQFMPQQQWQASYSTLQQGHGRPPAVRFGSDNNFSAQGYRAPNFASQPVDKDGNLLGLPLVQQAASAGQADASPFNMLNQQQPKFSSNSGFPGGSNKFRSAHSSPSGLSGIPTATPVSSAAQKRKTKPNASQASEEDQVHDVFDDRPVSKRRRGQQEDDPDDEYIPIKHDAHEGPIPKRDFKALKVSAVEAEGAAKSSTASMKRRKSVITRVTHSSEPSVSPAEAFEDDLGEGPSSTKAKSRAQKKQRENLSDLQKRQNHIQSEKKRRDVINSGYKELNKLVPSLVSGKSGLSRSESLQEVATYLEILVNGTANIMSLLGIAEIENDAITSPGQSRYAGVDLDDDDDDDDDIDDYE